MEPQPNTKVDLFDGTHPEARDLTKLQTLISTLDMLARYYFRTEAIGFDNVPERSSLVVGTHNGGLFATDMFMFFHAWYRRFGDDKPLFGLGHDIHFMNPLTREMMCRGGAIKANRENAKQVLSRENSYVAVYPTGARELFKPYYHRTKIDFHGHKGFVKLALESQVPIVPMVTSGADTFICLNEGDQTAKMLGVDKLLRMPVWPLMLQLPFGLAWGPAPHIPLPRQIRISVGPAIEMPWGPEAANDPAKVDALYERVQNTMQGMRDRLERVREVRSPLLPDGKELRERLEGALYDLRQVWTGSKEMVAELRQRAAG